MLKTWKAHQKNGVFTILWLFKRFLLSELSKQNSLLSVGEQMADQKKIKLDDRVKRVSIPGCLGTVKEIKTEVTTNNQEAREKNLMINVQWDNGTFSYLSPEALEVVN
jgi:hypothetical protein